MSEVNRRGSKQDVLRGPRIVAVTERRRRETRHQHRLREDLRLSYDTSRKLPSLTGLIALTVWAALAVATPAMAEPVSPAVKRACANDYFAHCSMHPVGTPAVRKCMRAVGPRLSQGCISALVVAGEVKASDRKRYKVAQGKTGKRRQ